MPPRKLGQLVSESFDAFYAGLGLYGPILLVAVVPGFILSFLSPGAGALVNALCSLAAYPALILAVDARLRGESTSAGEAFGRVPGVLGALIVSELLAALFIFGGLILLIIPGLIMAIRYGLTHFAVLVEGRSGRPALDRSSEIMKAHMGKVIGNTFVMGLITAALSLAVAVVFGLSGLPETLSKGFAGIAAKIVGGWGSVFAVMLYRDLAALRPEAAAVPVEAPAPQGP